MPIKLVYPTSSIKATFKVDGLFAIPDQWKATDQSNPGLFTYIARMSKFQSTKGKVFARQLTDKEKKEAQEKNKKGAKKQAKKQQDTAEQERLRKLQEEKQRERQQLFAKLTAQQQFYYICEDSFKSNILKFQNFSDQFEFVGQDCFTFQNRITKDKGDWVYIFKIPSVSEDQLAKMRKTKPKTLNNINDLNPVVMRAWVDLEALNSKTQKEVTVRCKINQVDKTPQTSQPNLQKTYIKITITLGQPLLKDLDSYTFQSLIKDPIKQIQISAQKRCIEQLKQQIKLAIQSLAMQYSNLFWKDLNMQQEQRNSAIFINNKKNQVTKRKEQFLYDFNISGKYKILKDRIKKCIVHICQTKYKKFFQGLKTFNGIKCNSKDQIYSEIYNLLIDSYKQTLANIIFQKKEDLQQVQVLQVQTRKKNTQRILTEYRDETLIERIKRVIRQYQILMDFQYGERFLLRYIQEYPQILDIKYYYAIYCIKYNLRKTNEVLPYIQEYLTKNKGNLSQQVKIQYMSLLINGGGQEALLKSWVIIREIIQKNPSESKFLLLASLILQQLKLQGLASKYFSKTLKSLQSQSTNHRQQPLKSEIPSVSSKANYFSSKNQDKVKQIYQELIQMFTKYSGFNIIEKIIKKMKSSSQKQNQKTFEQSMVELSKLLISHSEESFDKVIEASKQLYQKTNKVQALEVIIKGLMLKLKIGSQRSSAQLLNELQVFLKKSLVKNSQELNRFFTLLRLGYVYLKKQQYGNSKACLLKYLEKVKSTYNQYASGLSYKILGITYIKSQNIQQGIQCLKHANFCDTKNQQTWLFLSLGFSKLHKNVVTNQCLNQYYNLIKGRKSHNKEDEEILKQIEDTLKYVTQNENFYDRTIRENLQRRLLNDQLRG